MSLSDLAITAMLMLGPSHSLAAGPPPKAYTLEELGICRETVSKVVGPIAATCRALVSSQDFRNICAKVSDENRIRCDGKEPDGPFDIRFDLLEDCAKNIFDGAKDTVIEVKDAVVAIAAFAKEKGGAIVSTMGATSANATEKPASRGADALRANARQIAADEVTAYGAHVGADEEEARAFLRAIGTKEFWSTFASEVFDSAAQTVPQFFCLSPQAQNKYTCYVAGSVLSGSAMLKVLMTSVRYGWKAVKTRKLLVIKPEKATEAMKNLERNRGAP